MGFVLIKARKVAELFTSITYAFFAGKGVNITFVTVGVVLIDKFNRVV